MKTLIVPTPNASIAKHLIDTIAHHFRGAHFSLEHGGLWARIETDPSDFTAITCFATGFLAAMALKR